MNRVLIRCGICLDLAILPLPIMALQEWRDFAKGLEWEVPWFVGPAYWLGLLVFWLWWMNRPWPGDDLLQGRQESGSGTVDGSGDDRGQRAN
jgi:hypothetical protein